MSKITQEQITSPEARGKRIRFMREHLLSLTREEFCQDIDITDQSLKGWELGWGGGLSPSGAAKIVKRARELNIYCTEAWLLHGIGRAAMPITSDLDIQEGDEIHIAKELLTFRELHNSVDTIVKDDAMLPFLYPGNYVGGLIVENIGSAVNKDCIIILDNDEILVRMLRIGDEPNCYDLSCINDNPSMVKKRIKNAAIKFAAPIVWIRRVFRENS